jgi:hypothetical protein
VVVELALLVLVLLVLLLMLVVVACIEVLAAALVAQVVVSQLVGFVHFSRVDLLFFFVCPHTPFELALFVASICR